MRKLFLLIIVISMLANSGCIHRSLTIKSDPPGATAYFNDKVVGKTPVEFDFMWYFNSHRIRLEKEGYETFETRESIRCPWYLWIPLDLAGQLLPDTVEDHREFSYTLTPEAPVEEPPR